MQGVPASSLLRRFCRCATWLQRCHAVLEIWPGLTAIFSFGECRPMDTQVAVKLGKSYQPDSRQAWLRLAATVLISTIGGIGRWSVVVALPPVQAEFAVARSEAINRAAVLFGETASRVVISVAREAVQDVRHRAAAAGVPVRAIGKTGGRSLKIAVGGDTLVDVAVADAERAWSDAIERYFARRVA